MAVINKLGWSIDGETNSKVFMQYVMAKYGYSNEKKFMKKGNANSS